MRGSNPIVSPNQGTDSKTVEGGLGYTYATDWSFAPGEMMTWLVPSWYGFGNEKYKGLFTHDQEQMANFYSGPQPFTHAPQYMGLIVLLLAIYGFARNRKDPFVQYLGLMIVFSLFISFGREFPIVYDLMYKFFPMFNKFRIPSMILVLIQIFVPILAAYGIATLVRERDALHGAQVEKRKKSILLWFAVAAGSFVVLALTFESFITRQAMQNAFASVTRYGFPRDKIYEPFFQQVPPQVPERDHGTTRRQGNKRYLSGDCLACCILRSVVLLHPGKDEARDLRANHHARHRDRPLASGLETD